MIDNFMEWLKGICKSRLFPVVIIYTCLFSILIYRAFSLQIIEGSKLSQESEKKYNKERYIKSTRGNIYDCNGKLLAYNESSYSIIIEDVGELKKNDEKNAMIYKLINICIIMIQQHTCRELIFFFVNEKILVFTTRIKFTIKSFCEYLCSAKKWIMHNATNR